jgi:hypothetical protein
MTAGVVASVWLAACGSTPKGGNQQSPVTPFGSGAPVAPSTAPSGNGMLPAGMQMQITGAGGSTSPAPAPSTGGTPGPMMMMGAAGMMAPAPMMMMGNAGAAAPGANPNSLYDAATKELRAPAAGAGVQITTPMFDLAPGQEKFSCYHAEIPVDGEIDVHYWESKMTEGSHHFILYAANSDLSPVGTMDQSGCTTNFQNWVYSSAQPHIDLSMPEGVAMVLGSRQRVLFDMHYINTTQNTLHAQVVLNVVLAKGSFQKAASLISFNVGIAIPANGMQTVSGDCTPGAGAKFFYMLTHTHRRGLLATITRTLANGQMGEELVRSTDWEVPQEKKYLTDPYLTFMPGEKFHYTCQYMNDLPQVVTAGPSAATNEMCMAITYYFPSSATGSCN